MDLEKHNTRVHKVHKMRNKSRKPKITKKSLEEYAQSKYGASRDVVINRLKRTLDRRNIRINNLVDIIKSKEEVENELKKLARRELRKKDTKYRKLQERFEDFKKKNGQRNRVVVKRNIYKTYEPTKNISNFEDYVLKARELHQDYLGILEHRLKTLKFLKESEYGLDENDLQAMLILMVLGKPSKIEEVQLEHLSVATKRKILNTLDEKMMVRKPTHRFYELTSLGLDFLNNYKNFLSYGKSSEIYETFKKASGI